MNNYDIFMLSNLFSHTTSSEVNKESIVNNFSSALQSESDTGVDRTRASIGYSVQLNWLDQATSEGGLSIEILCRSLAETIIRIKNPNKLLFGGMDYILGATINEIVPQVDYVNMISLDYMEKYTNSIIDSGNTVLMQDLESGNIDDDYDVLFFELELFSHDFSIIDTAWDKLKTQGLMCLWSVNDFGSLYSTKNEHPYYEYFIRLTEDNDKYVFHIPIATGFTLVVKK